MTGSKRRGQNTPFCPLECHILPGQLRGKAQPAHCQLVKKQLAVLNNNTQKPFVGQCSPPLYVYHIFLVAHSFSYTPSRSWWRVQYFAHRHTHAHLYGSEHKQRQKPLLQYQCHRGNALLSSMSEISCSFTVFCLRKMSAWTNPELSCSAEVTRKPFPFSLSRSDLFNSLYALLQNGTIDSAFY